MEFDNHMIGFEKEEKYSEAFHLLRQQYPNIYKSKVLRQLLDIIDPNFCIGLFERKPCKRKLKYIGETYKIFKKDNIYFSNDFNGGTYTIEGYNRLIGSSYFEIIEG